MRKYIFLSLAILSVMALLITSFAFADEIKTADDSNNVVVISKKGAFLGIYMDDLNEKMIEKADYPKSTGVWVADVMEDSPAEKSGLEDGDIIYMIDDSKIKNTAHLAKLIGGKDPGDTVKIVAYRDGEKMEFKVELAEQARKYVTIDVEDLKKDPGYEIGRIPEIGNRRIGAWTIMSKGALGVSVHDLDEDLAGYFSVEPGGGVLVLDVQEDSAAEKAGIKGGDVIVEIAGEKISETDDIHDAIAGISEDEDAVEVVVVRKGDRKTVTVDVEEMSRFGNRIMISPAKKDYFKHFKVSIPEMKDELWIESLEGGKIEGELKDNIDKLKKELQVLEKRLKKLEKEDRDD